MTRARSNILLTTYYVFGSVLRILCRHYDSCLCIDEKTEVQGDEQKAHIRQSHSRSIISLDYKRNTPYLYKGADTIPSRYPSPEG